MQSPPEFAREVAHALTHLYDPDVLRKHALLHMLGLSKHPNAQNVLRERLLQAIEALKPEPDVPIESRAWRVYKVLHIRYVQQMDQEQTAYQIGVGVRHLRREQSAAVTALADVLYQKFDPALVNAASFSNDQPVSVEDELAWLQKNTQQETSSVNDILGMTLQLVAPLAKPRGIQMETQLDEELPPVLILPAALRQAFISLTTLAINRLPAGKIKFSTALQQQVVLKIEATGELPLLPETPATLESMRTVRMILGTLSSGLKTREDARSIDFILRLPALGQVNILMIDDNKDVADLFKRYIYGTAFSIEHLFNPDQVFETVEKLQPRIILLDIMIPKVDGWELLGRLRQHPLTHTCPIVVCSVLPERELALALGATDYLAKPVTRSALLKTLNQVLVGEPSTPQDT